MKSKCSQMVDGNSTIGKRTGTVIESTINIYAMSASALILSKKAEPLYKRLSFFIRAYPLF